MKKTVKEQVSAPETIKMGQECFSERKDTVVCWLGSGGVFINCRGTLLMIDPVICRDKSNPMLSEAGYPFLVPPPVAPEDIQRLDGILYTHADYDHMAPETAKQLMCTGARYHGTAFSVNNLKNMGIEEAELYAHNIGEKFQIGNVSIQLTPASHSWQKDRPEFDWCYGPNDCCGYIMETPDGTIWLPGDSVLMKEHLNIRNIDLMFLDVSTDPYHFGPDAAVRLANQLNPADLILYHYGTYDAPEKPAFNADPASVEGRIEHPERFHILAPGEIFSLKKKKL